MGKILALVLFKLFINGIDKCLSIEAPLRMSGTLFSNSKQHTIYDPKGPEKQNYTM